jgi:hypothetical protein
LRDPKVFAGGLDQLADPFRGKSHMNERLPVCYRTGIYN